MINKRIAFDSLLVVSLFMASNMSVFFSLLWLLPDIVYLEAILWVVLAIMTLWAIGSRGVYDKYISTIPVFWTIFPFVIYAGISVFWSVKWEVSLGRWLVLISTVVCGGYLGARYTVKRFLRFLALFGALMLMISGFYILILPDVGIMNYETIQGAWKGIFWHKNHFGLFASFVNLLSLVEALAAYRAREKSRVILWGLLFLLSFFCVVKSDSAAAIMVTIAMCGFMLVGAIWLQYKETLRTYHYAVFAIVFLLILVGIFTRLEVLFGLFDRSITLTGRIPMWAYLFDAYFSQQPCFGYGFNAFWYIESHQQAVQIAAGYPDPIIIADNGYIDILINTGLAGFLLFLLFYFDLWRRSLTRAIRARDLTGLLPFIVMVFILLANISWSVLFENENYFMLIMTALLASCSKPDSLDDGGVGGRI